jgi:hypothetical protein
LGHQDSDLELRAMFESKKIEENEIVKNVEEDPSPLNIDHDAVPSWRETARFFRKAA